MTIYKMSINGEEHELQGSWWEVQSPLTPWEGISIENDIISNTWVIEETVFSGDEWVSYRIEVSTNAPAGWTSSDIITIRKIL